MAVEAGSTDSQPISIDSSKCYHKSICGSILYCSPTKSPPEIFSFLLHGNLNAFRRSLDVYNKDIIKMKNEYDQTVLHVVVRYNYSFSWIRLLLMFRCDPCCQDIDGYTAAHYAVQRDDVEMLKALTTRIAELIKLFSDEQKTIIHESCLKALSVRENRGLTVFMLSCYHGSIKCLDYLASLQINDSHLQDISGDTCLHYAAARQNEILVNKLISQFNADVNGGDHTRPSVLDVLQFTRQQKKPKDPSKEDSIEQILLSYNAVNRCHIRCINQPVRPNANQESHIETANRYAQRALSLENQNDIIGAQKYYTYAINSVPNDSLDWSNYAFSLALLHIKKGENQLAYALLQNALKNHKRNENNTEDIKKIQSTIDQIQKYI